MPKQTKREREIERSSETSRRIAAATAERARKSQLVVPWDELIASNPAMDLRRRLSVRVTVGGSGGDGDPAAHEEIFEIRPSYSAENGSRVRLKLMIVYAETGIETHMYFGHTPGVESIIDGIYEREAPAAIAAAQSAYDAL